MKVDLSKIKNKHFLLLDSFILLPFLLVPLIIYLPFRLNIFLSWEGAYRLFIGQLPYKDFGIPMGFGYWLVPTIFFYLFGPFMLSLVKAQVFLNIIAYFSIRGILLKLSVNNLIVSISLLVFCLTYIVFNFWPWYNNTVIVFEFVAMYFGVSYFFTERKFDSNLLFIVLFSFLAFFTKQDVGAITIFFSAFLIATKSVRIRSVLPLGYFIVLTLLISLITILPFLEYDFLYWFNYGQFPHNSRISLLKILDYVMYDVGVEKLFLSLIIFLFLFSSKLLDKLIGETNIQLLFLLTLTFLLQVLVIRNTSPLGNDFTYFYVFSVAFFFKLLNVYDEKRVKLSKILASVLLLVFMFSMGYWKYFSAYFNEQGSAGTVIHKEVWKTSQFKSVEKIKMPESCIEGIKRIKPLFVGKDLKVLNMSELTFLAYEFEYTPIVQQPLWYHVGVGIFDREVKELSDKIKAEYYDIVLFEDIPSLDNFYPYTLRDDLKKYYLRKDKFLAPRKLEDSFIEVYIKNPQ